MRLGDIVGNACQLQQHVNLPNVQQQRPAVQAPLPCHMPGG